MPNFAQLNFTNKHRERYDEVWNFFPKFRRERGAKLGECWENVKIIGLFIFPRDFTQQGVIRVRNA